ncbi:hypothetical protein Megpolyxen_01897 (plasmid) [Candidatus Megaera polyxenophila]|nr:hypothetical protein Megpolyxen_01897 [Candidatus Megaera polyxenophila]
MKEALTVIMNCFFMLVATRLVYVEYNNIYLTLELIAIAVYLLILNMEHNKKCQL